MSRTLFALPLAALLVSTGAPVAGLTAFEQARPSARARTSAQPRTATADQDWCRDAGFRSRVLRFVSNRPRPAVE